jgi:hypothetical protein
MEKSPLPLENLGHVSPERFRESQDQDKVDDDVQNSKRGHAPSSFLKSVPGEARRKAGIPEGTVQ